LQRQQKLLLQHSPTPTGALTAFGLSEVHRTCLPRLGLTLAIAPGAALRAVCQPHTGNKHPAPGADTAEIGVLAWGRRWLTVAGSCEVTSDGGIWWSLASPAHVYWVNARYLIEHRSPTVVRGDGPFHYWCAKSPTLEFWSEPDPSLAEPVKTPEVDCLLRAQEVPTRTTHAGRDWYRVIHGHSPEYNGWVDAATITIGPPISP